MKMVRLGRSNLRVSAFGADRLMVGSDWPVCTLAAGYERTIDLARQLIGSLSGHERAQVLEETAQRVYRLPERIPTREPEDNT